MQADWLARTKLFPPRLREDFVPRQRLYDVLRAAIRSHPVTLVSAPAGYGKTTVLASFLDVFPDLPFAWISLGEEDNDPVHFLTVLLTCLRCLKPDFGPNTQAILESYSYPDMEARRVVAVLVNEVLDSLGEIWVVLDDLHLITEPVVYALLDGLLERLPPQMHLVIASRSDPPLALARLRARGQLAELRVPDLRFTTDEASLFLNDKQHLSLSPDDLAKLQSRAEGWAAGLRLLAGSLDHIPSTSDRSAFIRDLALTDRYIFDFLADEVLKRQDAEMYAFLLDTSILPELTPPLCNAITGRNDAQTVLEVLYRRNLFLSQLEGMGIAFRYHALFAEFLREQLRREYPERVAELHRRAAEAQKANAPSRSIAHYLAAELWDDAAQVIESVIEEFIRRGFLNTLREWIEALPASVRDAHPRLLYVLGMSALQQGDLNNAMGILESARLGFESNGDPAGQGEALLLMVDTASRQHDYEREAELTQKALAFQLPIHGQVQLLMAQVWRSVFQGDAKHADADLQHALNLTLESNDLRAFNVVAPILNMQLAFLPGGTTRLERYCHDVLSRFGNGVGAIQACAHSLLGYLFYQSGAIKEAIREAEQARGMFNQIGVLAYSDWQTRYVEGLLAELRGDPFTREKLWTESLPQIEQTPSLQPYLVAAYYNIGRAQWAQKKYHQLRQTEARIAARIDPEEFPETLMARKLMRALVEITDHEFDNAEQTLKAAMAIEQRWRHAALFGSSRVMLAYLYLQSKHVNEAWMQFAPFLVDCEQRNMSGLILQEAEVAIPLLHFALERKSHAAFAQRLLDQLSDSHRPVPVPETGQTLTTRELEVLNLIAGGASNQAIAKRLVISEHTVKAHITSILAKMQVTSRTEAVARARDLRLV